MSKQKKNQAIQKVSENVVQLPFMQGIATTLRIGRLLGVSDNGEPLIICEGYIGEPVVARSIVALDIETVEKAAVSGREVLLAFIEQKASQPVIMGWLQGPIKHRLPEPDQPRDVHLKGDRVVLEAKKQVVIKTEKGSITLRRNGVVKVDGMHVETRSRGVQRIKGARIEIN